MTMETLDATETSATVTARLVLVLMANATKAMRMDIDCINMGSRVILFFCAKIMMIIILPVILLL